MGWALADHMRTELCLDALRQAIALRGPSSGLIHHTDRGSQYASAKYSNLLKEVGAIASMSRTGNCWDNAVAESFFGTLKQEAVKGKVWRSLAKAQADIADFIHGFYNAHRAHSTNGGLSPVTAEQCVSFDRLPSSSLTWWSAFRGQVRLQGAGSLQPSQPTSRAALQEPILWPTVMLFTSDNL
jgi:putative transposase